MSLCIISILRRQRSRRPFKAAYSARDAGFKGLCRGLPNKELAREMELQEFTVKLHVKTLCRKLEAKNRTHAAMIGKKAGVA